MRWLTYLSPTDGDDRIGLLHHGAIHGLRSPRSLIDLLDGGPVRLQQAADAATAEPAEVVDQASVSLRAPVPAPSIRSPTRRGGPTRLHRIGNRP
jgi:hypothetical protein